MSKIRQQTNTLLTEAVDKPSVKNELWALTEALFQFSSSQTDLEICANMCHVIMKTAQVNNTRHASRPISLDLASFYRSTCSQTYFLKSF